MHNVKRGMLRIHYQWIHSQRNRMPGRGLGRDANLKAQIGETNAHSSRSPKRPS